MGAESLKIVLWEEQYLGEGLDTPSDKSALVLTGVPVKWPQMYLFYNFIRLLGK